jgi:hypothetical protein
MDRAIRRLKKRLDREGTIRDVRDKRYFRNLLIRKEKLGKLLLSPKCFVLVTRKCSFKEILLDF